MRAKIVGIVMLTAPIVTIAHAASEPKVRQSPAFDACMNKAGGVTGEMMSCLGTEIDVQDARLNQTYRMIMQRLSPARKGELRDAERAWIIQRNVKCQKDAMTEGGGSIAGLIYNSCILDETMGRTTWLERHR